MKRRKLTVLLTIGVLWLLISTSQAASREEILVDALVNNLTHPGQHIRINALKAIEKLGNPAAIPALIELLRFDRLYGLETATVLERLAGEKVGKGWPAWVEWLQKHDEIRPNERFVAWKANLLSTIDPAFEEFLHPDVPHRVRIEEIVWGGVTKDGIPALTNPKHVAPEKATYLTPGELVFGVSINGDHRAYPHRMMDWHEMFNDVVGGKSVTLSY